ncbi:DNA-processing protein DprA [Amycolatopsis thermoflava]|uniref:DNA-processing protein DprA n=1 Tax=Amycolatopsis thermoflava TaxID=84480 RepID=UPI00380A4096
MTTVDDVRLARAYLSRVAEPGAPALSTFVAQHGPVAAAEAIRDRDCPLEVLQETNTRQHPDDVDLDAAAEAGIRLIIPEDDEWPSAALHHLTAASPVESDLSPPLALWARGSGDLDHLTAEAITITGSRTATAYGEHVAAELAQDLGHHGHTVISGGAYGVDAAAHRGALSAGTPTVAVLACGIDVGYPAGNVTLLGRIAHRGGLVISEYPPGTPPARHRFLTRNRLLAALPAGVVVVEAGRRSGVRATALLAGGLGKAVMAVPGPVTSAMSSGCHELIRHAGATLVTGSSDVHDVLRLARTRENRP